MKRDREFYCASTLQDGGIGFVQWYMLVRKKVFSCVCMCKLNKHVCV